MRLRLPCLSTILRFPLRADSNVRKCARYHVLIALGSVSYFLFYFPFFFTLVLQATLPGTWSQEPLYYLSEFRYIVYSLAYEHRLFTRTHTSTSPPPRRIQPTHLYKRTTSSLARTIQHSLLGNSSICMACLNLRVEKHFGWACLEERN